MVRAIFSSASRGLAFLFFGGGLAIIALGVYLISKEQALKWEFATSKSKGSEVSQSTQPAPKFSLVFQRSDKDKALHVPSLAALSGSKVALTWYEGSREGAQDVALYRNFLTKKNGVWLAGDSVAWLDAKTLEAKVVPYQKIDVIGNGVMTKGSRTYVTVRSLGGWSLVKIAALDEGEDSGGIGDSKITNARILPTAGFFGRTSAVRSVPIYFADGSVGLPIYHELFANFSELLRVNPKGRVVAKVRISKDFHEIQPSIVALDEKHALAFFRSFMASADQATLRFSASDDGGKTWGKQQLSGLPNPNSPVAGVRLSNGAILLAFNDDPARRDVLRLAISHDRGKSWRRIYTLEAGGKGAGDARYPNFVALGNKEYMLTYSHPSKKGVKVFLMNEAWLLSQ